MPNLRSHLIRLASEHPELRKDLLPLLKQAGEPGNLSTFAFRPTKEDQQLISSVRREAENLTTQFWRKEAQKITNIDQAWRLSLVADSRRIMPEVAEIFRDRAYELDR